MAIGKKLRESVHKKLKTHHKAALTELAEGVSVSSAELKDFKHDYESDPATALKKFARTLVYQVSKVLTQPDDSSDKQPRQTPTE
jgi:hypothetical protein